MISENPKYYCAPNVGTFGSFAARSFGLQAVAATPTPSPTPTSTPTRTPTPTPCPSFGTLLSYSGACSGTTFNVNQVFANGSCGTYSNSYWSLSNSQNCGASVNYPYSSFGLLVNGNYYILGPTTFGFQLPGGTPGTNGPGFDNLQFYEGGSFTGKMTVLTPNTNPLFLAYGMDTSFSSYLTAGYTSSDTSSMITSIGGYQGYVVTWYCRYPSPGSGTSYIDLSYYPY